MQGGTLGSMLCAARPEYNQKISVLALLGPVRAKKTAAMRAFVRKCFSRAGITALPLTGTAVKLPRMFGRQQQQQQQQRLR